MTDNSPEYFERMAKDAATLEPFFEEALRAAAALARENAELRENLRVVNEQKVHENRKWSEHCESAESANRALQAAIEVKNKALRLGVDAFTHNWAIDWDELTRAIAYTGTEPQEKP